ncbi:hypothetical protein VTL71DRAFT_10117 [Oculimacula yallundae]|uniref:Glucose-methanol-choline oxidoreductase N-terminal domain-containing protein n=1 Tax=Oculimacula yallundae TaxID=86028 RepID=A0ABR4BQG3_9HELO
MPLHTKLPDPVKEVDIIIAGGGTAGCVLATRLSQADPQLSILVIEEGYNNDLPSITFPILFMANLDPKTGTAKFYTGSKASELAGREPIVPTGSVLGGGSSINMMTYTRAQRSDLDSWNTLGWSANEIIPYIKKLETYHGPVDTSTHGFQGPIHVSSGPFESPRVTDDFITAAGKLGYTETLDLSDLDTINEVQRNLRYISPEGKRQDAASCYLHPILQDGKYPNLYVVLNTTVLRVLIEDAKAVGVEIRSNLDADMKTTTNQSTVSVRARKMVVLSCGALGTPTVLERSGVGSSEILKQARISLVADIPGVGNGYQDHQLLLYPYRSSLEPEETLDALVSGRIDPGELIQKNDPMLGWNGQEVTSRIRPTDEEVAILGSEYAKFAEVWNSSYKPFPDRPLVHLTLVPAFAEDQNLVPVGQYFSVSAFTLYPESRGYIHVTGPETTDPIDFKPGFFSDPDQVDIKAHVWVYKKQRELVRRMRTYRGEIAIRHPPFAATSAACCIEIDEPLTDIQNLVYSPEDDIVIEQWLREHVGSTWHSLGTCKMAPLSELGVVDAHLGVHGIKGLKISDLSIVPSNIAANTNNMALVIGEKAADIIMEDLSLEVLRQE